jgi:hypothetical protein
MLISNPALAGAIERAQRFPIERNYVHDLVVVGVKDRSCVEFNQMDRMEVNSGRDRKMLAHGCPHQIINVCVGLSEFHAEPVPIKVFSEGCNMILPMLRNRDALAKIMIEPKVTKVALELPLQKSPVS